MSRIALVGAFVALFFFAAADASAQEYALPPASQDSSARVALVPGSGLRLAESMAREFWAERNVQPCGPTRYSVGNLDFIDPKTGKPLDVLAAATPTGCSLTLDRPTLEGWRKRAQARFWITRREAKRERCAAIIHEYGHLAGLMFTLPNGKQDVHDPNPDSVMAALLYPQNDVQTPWTCRKRWPL